jgi:oligopeptide transport system ATP-binding protein
MYAGALVESGLTEEIYKSPKHPYTIGLLGSVPRLDSPRKENLRIIKGLPPNLAHLPPGCSFWPRCDYAMDRCKEEKPTLEPVDENHFRACFYPVDELTKNS